MLQNRPAHSPSERSERAESTDPKSLPINKRIDGYGRR